jgi:uncharacterized RDD family membrane protein YckC
MTNSNNTGQLDLGHWIIRLIAYIIDAVIISVVSGIIGIILAVGYGLFFFSFGILSLLYFIILDVAWGATIGKRLMGLQVQKVTGGTISIDKSFIRNISKIFPLLLFLDWLAAVVTAGADRRQKLTDRWAGTTVAQAGKSPINFSEPTSSSPPPPPTTLS